MDGNNQMLEGKLVESLGIKELGKLAEQYANVDIGSVLDEKTFDGIPVISNIVGIIKTGFNIRDRLYIKKIAYFLVNVKGFLYFFLEFLEFLTEFD